MARTVADYLSLMRHAIGNPSGGPATGVSLLETLNDSLKELFTCHDWNWRIRPPALIDLVASQEYAALPADFGQGELLTIHSTANPTRLVVKKSLSEIATMRGQIIQSYYMYFVAVSWPTQTSTSVAPGQARLEVWPTPAENITGAFRVVYKSGPVALTSNSQVPNIPPAFEMALSRLARANILLLEDDADSAKAIAERQLADKIIADLMQEDGMTEKDLGAITGGAAFRGMNPTVFRPFAPSDIPVH